MRRLRPGAAALAAVCVLTVPAVVPAAVLAAPTVRAAPPSSQGARRAAVRPRVEIGRRGGELLTVRATGVPLAELLARIEAETGVPIERLSPILGLEPVTVEAGPAPVDRLVRELVRPHGLALVYAPGGPAAPLVRVVVVPAGGDGAEGGPAAADLGPRAAGEEDGAAGRPLEVADAEPEPAAGDGVPWRPEDLGPGADSAEREAAVLALGESLDDPEAVALLEAVARGDAGLDPDDPARRLARRILDVRPGGADEGE